MRPDIEVNGIKFYLEQNLCIDALGKKFELKDVNGKLHIRSKEREGWYAVFSELHYAKSLKELEEKYKNWLVETAIFNE